MAQYKNKQLPNRTKKPQKIQLYRKEILTAEFWKDLLYNPKNLYITSVALIVFEVLLNVFIIERVKYTEIDWRAYMQEVEGFLNGTYNYDLLKGDTGPLVYPAGFVYIYSVLYYLTSSGENVRLAQYLFLILYVFQIYLVFQIYSKTQKIPPYALILSTVTSYRIHSIYVLRLFNDPFAVCLFYLSLTFFMKNRWYLGSILYSLAVSVKMNILLYSPCLLIAYLTNLTYGETIVNLFICGMVQVILGLPFLLSNFWGYINGAFNFGRVFEHRWTVNYRFLDREMFENKSFHFALLAIHISLLIAFFPLLKKYLNSYYTLNKTILDLGKKDSKKTEKPSRRPSKDKVEVNFSSITRLFVLPFFVTNLIGIACSRSLHYQFYSWYFHSLLYLVHSTPFRKPVIFLLLAVIEFCWNTYPSTQLSSVLLHFCHVTILYGVYKVMSQK